MNVKSFGSFLDSMKSTAQRTAASPTPGRDLQVEKARADVLEPVLWQPAADEDEKLEELLPLFPENRQPIAVSDLLKAGRLGVVEFTLTLGRLRQLGLVEATATEPEETFALTALGEARAHLNR